MTGPADEPVRYDIALEVDDIAAGAVDIDAVAALLSRVLAEDGVEAGTGLSVTIAGDALLRDLNHTHRGVDSPTDVLSFAAEEGEAFPSAPGEPRYLGDIAVSIESVRRNAAEAALALDLEVQHVLVHGLLHLLGYDHETAEDEATMRTREESVLDASIHAGGGAHTD